jgi:hypothetical protein
MKDPLLAHVAAIRAQAQAQLSLCDALLAHLGELDPAEGEVPTKVACPRCMDTQFQARAGDVGVCGAAGCGANYRNGEVVDG